MYRLFAYTRRCDSLVYACFSCLNSIVDLSASVKQFYPMYEGEEQIFENFVPYNFMAPTYCFFASFHTIVLSNLLALLLLCPPLFFASWYVFEGYFWMKVAL